MTRLKRRILIGTALVVLVFLGLGIWLYFTLFASTSAALQRAEAFMFRRMKVVQLAEQGGYRFFYVTNRGLGSDDGPLEERFGAVVDRLLKHLKPDRHELVLFDINRFAAKSSLLISDPAPLTARLMADKSLPFVVTLVNNENPASRLVLAHRKPPFSAEASRTAPLNLAWPQGLISLSHVALPFPPDDPLYGQTPPDKEDILFLGWMAIQSERNLLKIPYSFLVRLRYNPFYTYLETRVLEWFDESI